MENKVIRQR